MTLTCKLRLTAAALALLAYSQAAAAQNRKFDIPAQPAVTGIQALGGATGLQIIASDVDVRGMHIAAVRGEMSPRAAVDQALRGTGLYVASDDGRTLVIKRVPAGQTAVVEVDSDEIVVSGIRQSLDQSLDVRRQSDRIVDAIVAEDIGKLPDQNVIETLQRIPGVQITRVQGEGGDFVIRGISQNQIQFNGAMLGGPTSDGSGRLQEFNPEILGALEVIKSPSADTTEGALGGTINLITKKPLDLDPLLLSGRVQGSYYDRAERVGYQISAMASAKTDDGRLGALIGFTHHDYTRSTHSFDTSGWTMVNVGTANQMDTNNDGVANAEDQRNVVRPLRMVNNYLWLDHVRNGYNAAIQFRPTPELEFNFDAAITDTMIRLDALRLQAILTNAATNVTLSENGTVLKATYTNPNLRPANFQETYDTRQEVYSLQGKYEKGPFLAELRGTHSTGSRKSFQGVPLLTTLAGTTTSVITDFTTGADVPGFELVQNYDPMDPENWRLESHYETLDVIRSKSNEAKLDLTYRLDGWLDRVKAGARYQDTDLSSVRYAQNPSAAAILVAYPQADLDGNGVITANEIAGLDLSGFPGSSFLNGVSGDIVRDWLAGPVDFDETRAGFGLSDAPLSLSTVRDARQKQVAGYVMVGLDGMVGSLNLKGDAGLRYVHIDRKSGGYVVGTETYYQTYRSKFDYLLPSINLRTLLAPDLQARVSAARVIASPALTSVAPGLSLNQVSFTGSRGNPDLKPYQADQLDLALEWYFAPASALASTFFYKKINSFTVNTIVEAYFENGINSGFYRVTQPTNGDSGNVKGFEIAYQQVFPQLPGLLSGSGLTFSYTFADSDTPLVNSLSGKKDPLPGLSRHSFNTSAFIEQDWGNVRLTYSWRDAYLNTVQTAAAGGNLYTRAYGQLDATFQYNISSRIKLNLDLINMNGAANQTYVGYKERTRLYEVNDRRAYFGIRANF